MPVRTDQRTRESGSGVSVVDVADDAGVEVAGGGSGTSETIGRLEPAAGGSETKVGGFDCKAVLISRSTWKLFP
jgi:hypothetical protein